MSSGIAVRVENLSQCYQVYSKPSERLLQILSLGKIKHRRLWVLRDISFEMKQGEAIGIIGRKNSGKSTLLQLIYGTLSPSLGALHVWGRVAALLELGAGFEAGCTGRENVYMTASMYGLSREEINFRFSAIAAFSDIGGFMEQPLMTYTNEMCIRLAFSIAAHVDADVLLIDDVLSLVDVGFLQKCMRFMQRFKEEHSLILVSHDMDAVIRLCDRAIWLDSGRERQAGPSGRVCRAYADELPDSVNNEPMLSSVARAGGHDGPRWCEYPVGSIKPIALEVLPFERQLPGVKASGGKDALIVDVALNDASGVGTTRVFSGELVILEVKAQTFVLLENPIIEFFIKDHLGQRLFGDSTDTRQGGPLGRALADSTLLARFEFFMPGLARGDYVIQVAITEGERHDHRQLHCCHEALVIRSAHGLGPNTIKGVALVQASLSRTDRYK